MTLRPLDAVAETGLWLAPDGALELRQRVLPLDQEIEVFGALIPSGQSRFAVEAAGLAAGIDADWKPIEDWFAPAQFVAMTPDERLSAPSFEAMHAGVSLNAAGFSTSKKEEDLAEVGIEYEELVLEDDTRRLGRNPLAAERFGFGLRVPALALSVTASRRAVGNLAPFSVAPSRYILADALDASPIGHGAAASFVDAIVARRGMPSMAKPRARIVPATSAREIAA